MSVTAAQGFRAGSVAAGLAARGGADFTIVVNDGPLDAAAAVFTTNKATAHPIRWSKVAILDGAVRAVVLNAGGANCFTGPEGFTLTHRTAEVTAESLSADAVAQGLPEVSASDVLVCSTGLIGEPLPSGAVINAIPVAVAHLDSSAEAGETSSQAIMTTDTHPKRVLVEVSTDTGSYTIGGMAKGAGMLAPGLATMLVVVTTDASLSAPQLDRALRAATRVSFDRLDSDGCMSTNDQVTLMASGASTVTPDEASFTAALTDVCLQLAMALLADGEGASHNIAIEVEGAPSEDDAVTVARSVARNNLFKAAIFGNDPNWGRVLAAIGTTDVEFDPDQVDVSMNGVRVCHEGTPDRPRSEVDLSPRDTHVLVNLRAGSARATVWTNDLTHDYVHENSAYSS